MCGFAGVVTWDEKYRVTRDTLEKMSRAIAHRGPDGEGYHLTRENEPITPDTPQIGLAFRRLAILDPDPRSNQPFHIGPLTLVFNGEIYNFRDLKAEISKLRPDYHWRTTGDTEVLLMAYEVWREKCVEKLNGMFAFAVWDESKKELFLARDRMGQKPLYFAVLDQLHPISTGFLIINKQARNAAFAFGSEMQALRQLADVDTSPRESFIADYLTWGYSSFPIYRGIGKLPNRATVTIRAESILDRCYDWSGVAGEGFRSERKEIDDTIAARQTRTIVSESVRKQLVSDVPIGCFLSGGIDSSVIVAAIRASLSKDADRPRTFTVGFDNTLYDERRYAEEVATYLGTIHESIVVKPDAANDLSKIAETFDEPFGDSSSLPTYYLSREMGKRVKVCLSGDGGDEVFGGYDRYRAMRWSDRVAPLGSFARGFSIEASGHPKARWTRVKRFLNSLHLPSGERYNVYMSLDGRKPPQELIEKFCTAAGNRPLSVLMRFNMAQRELGDVVRAAMATDRFLYLPLDLLTKVDRCSMRFGLEVRSPFMDHELVQFAAGLTTDQLLKGGPKRMLREAFAKDLPDFVFKRKKMGFAVPIGEWFRGELRPMLRDNLFAANAFGRTHFNMKVVERLVEEHETQRVDHSQRLYALLMLELWWQQQVK